MLRKTMIVLATAAALIGGLSADAFARGGGGRGGGHVGGFGGRGGFVRNPTTLLGAPAPQMPENRIPAPLAAPAQAPVINGPMSEPAFRGLSGIGQ
jgi:hypothetical protein